MTARGEMIAQLSHYPRCTATVHSGDDADDA
jgi:hypothetical protein